MNGFLEKLLFIGAALLILFCPVGVCAQDEENVKIEKGLRFAVPADWPIEERNGALTPIPVEEYVIKKFKAIEARLVVIENKFAEKLDDSKDKESLVMKSETGEPASGVQGQLEALVKDVEKLKSQAVSSGGEELERTSEEKNVSDRNIAEQIRLIKKRLEDVERRLGVVEFHQDI